MLKISRVSFVQHLIRAKTHNGLILFNLKLATVNWHSNQEKVNYAFFQNNFQLGGYSKTIRPTYPKWYA